MKTVGAGATAARTSSEVFTFGFLPSGEKGGQRSPLLPGSRMGQFTGKPASGSGSPGSHVLISKLLRLLQTMSFGRSQQLQGLQQIMEEMSNEIMWVNDREEEELVFDWGDKNIDQYIPRKQESYSVSGALVLD